MWMLFRWAVASDLGDVKERPMLFFLDSTMSARGSGASSNFGTYSGISRSAGKRMLSVGWQRGQHLCSDVPTALS